MNVVPHHESIEAYRRELPGGGFVAIDVQRSRPHWWSAYHFEGEVIVERRVAPRADRDVPPVIARAAGDTVEEVVQALLPAARCNATIGAALLRIGAADRGLAAEPRREARVERV